MQLVSGRVSVWSWSPTTTSIGRWRALGPRSPWRRIARQRPGASVEATFCSKMDMSCLELLLYFKMDMICLGRTCEISYENFVRCVLLVMARHRCHPDRPEVLVMGGIEGHIIGGRSHISPKVLLREVEGTIAHLAKSRYSNDLLHTAF